MASPLTSSHLPVPSRTCVSSSVIVPSERGPMFRRRLPFLLTISIRLVMTYCAVLKVLPFAYPQELLPTASSVCQGRRRTESSLPLSRSRTATPCGEDLSHL